MAALQIKTVIIRAGEALSDGIDLSGMLTIQMPDEWEPARLSFQLSPANVIYSDLCDFTGAEIQINVRAGTAVAIPERWSSALSFMKFRSGISAAPVIQKAERTFRVAIAPGS